MLVDRGERVLALAHANVAVDVAMLRVADAFEQTSLLESSGILRVGEAQHPDARDREAILVDTAIARSDPDLMAEVAGLERRRRSLTAALRASSDEGASDSYAAELRWIRDRLSGAREEYRAAASDAIAAATVIGATLSRFVLSDDVWAWEPDAILLDEASMVSFPWVLLAATRAERRLVVFGDFRQLPPIVLATSAMARRWLGSDAFEVAGVRARIDDGEPDERVTLLDMQYRSASMIGSTVSDLAYEGRLTTDPAADERTRSIASASPWPGDPLVLVDTSDLGPTSQIETRAGSYSRLNLLHLALGLTLAAMTESDVALVSPYRAQARALFAAVRFASRGLVTASTIHRSQGSERDVVIFDLVDAPPASGPSRLTGGDVDLALRLVNVALSRARGKAIVLANLEFVASSYAPASPVRRLVELCQARGIVVRLRPDELAGAPRTEWAWSSSWAETQAAIAADLRHATRSAVLNVPDGIEVSASLVEALLQADARGLSITVLAFASSLRPLEASTIDLRLRSQPSVFALLDDERVLLGGRTAHVFASTRSSDLASSLRSMIVPDITTPPSVDEGSSERERNRSESTTHPSAVRLG